MAYVVMILYFYLPKTDFSVSSNEAGLIFDSFRNLDIPFVIWGIKRFGFEHFFIRKILKNMKEISM